MCVCVAPPLPTLQDDASISKKKVIGYYEYLVSRTATSAHSEGGREGGREGVRGVMGEEGLSTSCC